MLSCSLRQRCLGAGLADQARWRAMVSRKIFRHVSSLGPRLVTSDELPNPNALKIATRLNGKTVQDWTTSDMTL